MEKIKLEICVYSPVSCIAAQKGGADRIELCAGMPEGGITPSLALIEFAKNNLTIDTMVMIRPRGGDFLYDDYEFELMKKDILLCKRIGVKGVVFGVLTPEGDVDKQRNKILLDCAAGMETCFHRAIDMTRDYVQSASTIADLGFTRILTSGGQNKALHGVENIKLISDILDGRTEIMAGSGVNPDNIKEIYDKSHPHAFHFSAKKTVQGGMKFKNPVVSMGGVGDVSEYDLSVSDAEEIRRAVDVIKSIDRQ